MSRSRLALRTEPFEPAPPPAAAPSVPPAPPLEALVPAAIAGDELARAALIEALLPRARNLVRYLVRGDDEADDIVQDALIKVLERLHTYRGEGSLAHWSDGVIVRVTLHRLRRLRARLRRFVSSTPEALELQSGASDATPIPQRYWQRRQLIRALDRLPYAQRHALVLHHVLGMTLREAAVELQIPVETLHSRLRLAMTSLRRQKRAAGLGDGEERR